LARTINTAPGPVIAADLRSRRPKPRTIWHWDEVFLKIDGLMIYLLRAIDAEGEVISPQPSPVAQL
jgi:putative transposase